MQRSCVGSHPSRGRAAPFSRGETIQQTARESHLPALSTDRRLLHRVWCDDETTTKDDQNEGTIFDGTEPLNCVLKTDDTVLINSRSMNCTRSIPRSKSCPDFGSSNGVSSKRIKGQDNSIFNNGVGIEEAALRTQGDSRTIYRNRSISSSTFEG